MAVAWAQLIFNVAMTLTVLVLLRIFQRRVEQFSISNGSANDSLYVGQDRNPLFPPAPTSK